MEVLILGAGQEVGRSCVVIKILNKFIMLDCGLHMGFSDQRRFPDFNLLQSFLNGQILDMVIISHFHLDHCGSIPLLYKMVPFKHLVMSTPTKALLFYMLDDYRKVQDNEDLIKEVYHVNNLRKIVELTKTISLNQSVLIDDIFIKSYYAGHVLGACMFYVRVNNISFVYTGDFNSSADRHLGPAFIDKIGPDLIISESTYATLTRDSKR